MTRSGKGPAEKAGIEPRSAAVGRGALPLGQRGGQSWEPCCCIAVQRTELAVTSVGDLASCRLYRFATSSAHNNSHPNYNNNRIQSRKSEIFYSLLTAPRTVSDTYAQVARAQSCANHAQHTEHLSRATCRVTCTWYEGTAQLLSLTEFKSHLFELYFIG